MNKAFRILFLISLTTIVCASCHKVEELFPETFERNDKPFSVEAVPPEGCNTIVFYRIRVRGNDTLIDRFNLPEDSLDFNAQDYRIGDSIILEAYPKNGYTFINWVRDGVRITDSTGVDISTQPVYGFKVNENDTIIKIKKAGNTIDTTFFGIKYHYEARFGIDYAIQSIPSIDEVIPAALINIMGDSSFLYFGDNPPSIDTCFAIPNIPGLDFIMIDTVIKYNPMTSYYRDPQAIEDQRFSFMFLKQHRCIAEKLIYERCYDSIGSMLDKSVTTDSIFIMGEGQKFTVYYKQKVKFKASEDLASFLEYLEELVRYESVIISGIIDENGPGTGITHFHLGVIVDGYSDPTHMAVGNIVPGINDILLYSYPDTLTLTYDPTFYLEHIDD